MKDKRIFMALVFLFVCIAVNAEFEIGVKKGINLCTQYGYDRTPLEQEFVGFFNGGLFVEFPISSSISLESGLSYSVKGRKDTAPGFTDQLMLTYISLPAAVKYVFLDGWIISNLYTGAEVSIAINGTSYIGDPVNIAAVNLGKDELHFFDAGLLLGTEIKVPFGPYIVLLDFRFTLSLLPAVPEQVDEKPPRNAVFSILLGYGLRF